MNLFMIILMIGFVIARLSAEVDWKTVGRSISSGTKKIVEVTPDFIGGVTDLMSKRSIPLALPAPAEDLTEYHCDAYEQRAFDQKMIEAGLMDKDAIARCDNKSCPTCKVVKLDEVAVDDLLGDFFQTKACVSCKTNYCGDDINFCGPCAKDHTYRNMKKAERNHRKHAYVNEYEMWSDHSQIPIAKFTTGVKPIQELVFEKRTCGACNSDYYGESSVMCNPCLKNHYKSLLQEILDEWLVSERTEKISSSSYESYQGVLRKLQVVQNRMSELNTDRIGNESYRM